MKHAKLVIGAIFLCSSPLCAASEQVLISAKQTQALGITLSSLPVKTSGEVSGLPAQVIIPGNQLFIISTPLAAMIEQTLVGIGDSVKKGQVIARLQSPAIAEAQRGLLQASIQNQIAAENLTRDESLYKDGIISETRYRTSKGTALEAQAALSERKSMLRASGMSDSAITQLQLSHNLNSQLTLTSPIDGVVLEKTASAGQRLDASTPLFKIARVDPLALEIQAPLSAIKNLKIGAAISIPGFSASGKLTAIGHSLTGSNQTVMLRGVILQGSANLRPGQFVEASISTSAGNSVQWEIPNSAISRIAGKNMIFVQTAQGFTPQNINILHEGAQNSVITGNLKGDEKIATGGVSALKSSMTGIGDK